jgi:sugar/nucleoside kinase (ribokinase family)
MQAYDVLTIGRSCVDFIIAVDEFPHENSKMSLDSRLMEAGGQGGTSACCVSKLGGNVAYIGQVGDDTEGQFCLSRLNAFDVDTKFVKIIPEGKTPIAYIIVTKSNGNRTIVYEKNSLPKLNIKSIPQDLIFNSKVIMIDPETTYLIKDLDRKLKAKIVYDCERWKPDMEYMLKSADFFIPSSEFLDSTDLFDRNEGFFKKIIRLNQMVKNQLIITNGENGVYFFNDKELYHVNAPKINVKDTIGAGDNFNAAFSLAISKEYDLHEAVKFAVSVATLSCSAYGGKNGIPDFHSAQDVAKELFVKKIDYF